MRCCTSSYRQLLLCLVIAFTASAAKAQSSLVISQVYPGGGSNSTWKYDFIELFNPSDSLISLNDYSLQYSSIGGTFIDTDSTKFFRLTGKSIKAHSFFLVACNPAITGERVGSPDAVSDIAMSSTLAGKVALANTVTPVSGTTPSNLVDFVAWGSTSTFYEGQALSGVASTSTSVARTRTTYGFNDTNINADDFVIGPVQTPRNSSISLPAAPSGTSTPAPPAFVSGLIGIAVAGLPVIRNRVRLRRRLYK